MHDYREIIHARDYIREQTDLNPTIGIVLEMETDHNFDFLEDHIIIQASNIPFFPSYFLENQHKELILGKYAGKSVVILKGRYKYFEGYSIDHITFPIRVLQTLGVKNIILTRIGGAINPRFKPGELMLVYDHVNFTGLNPLIGPNDERLGPRVLDLTKLYDPNLIALTNKVAASMSIHVNEGILAWFTGPAFETPAEIRILNHLGIDAVASALVPEAIVSHHGGLNVLSMVLLTNKAAGLTEQPIEQSTILATAKQQQNNLISLIKGIIKDI